MTDPTPAPAPQGNPNPDPANPNPAPDLTPNPSPDPSPSPNPAPAAKAEWGETWREEYAKVAGPDEPGQQKILARLKRFASAKDALDWAFNADKKISDGSYKKPLGEKATAEEITEYRKANGIPDDPAGYFAKLPDGLVIGEDDKPVMEAFAKALHGVHADPKTVQAALKWYYDFQDEQIGKGHELNTQAKQKTEDALREKWGPDYRPNTNVLKAFIGSMPETLQEQLFQAFMPDGTQLMNNPEMVEWMTQQARELRYTGTILPSGQSEAKALDKEMGDLQTLMANQHSEYWKGPKADTHQKRYRELLEIQERIAKRSAA